MHDVWGSPKLTELVQEASLQLLFGDSFSSIREDTPSPIIESEEELPEVVIGVSKLITIRPVPASSSRESLCSCISVTLEKVSCALSMIECERSGREGQDIGLLVVSAANTLRL